MVSTPRPTINAFNAEPSMPDAPSTMFPSVPVLKARLQGQPGARPKCNCIAEPRRRLDTITANMQLPLHPILQPLPLALARHLELSISRTLSSQACPPTTAATAHSQHTTLHPHLHPHLHLHPAAAPRHDPPRGAVVPTWIATSTTRCSP